MLTLTHELLRNAIPENFGWMFLDAVIPGWQSNLEGRHRHDFEPQLGWKKVDAPEEHADRVGNLPSSTYVDPTGTTHMTIAINGEVLPIFITGDGWEIGCVDAHGDSFEEVEALLSGRKHDNWPFHFYS
ncbi:hypothetical protein [Erythrobacter aureus]|uniref:Uncharacterized protein n=1 Tax=Erythrobacter aureus TaxID=2182384 RepID=A0A345YIU7_9SPHN|nr:hypothetical protein [Erythrobacter aureus]AXK43849.1 hypothetical protein DVR09_15455 [Erythrobacter aureus]